jgi:urease accessory protein
MKRLLLTALLVAKGAGPAAAHSPVKGIGTFYNGMLHPYMVPGHVLMLLALGLLIGQHAPASSKYSLPVFAGALLCSAGILPWLSIASASEPILLTVALVAGLIVATSIVPGRVAPVLLAIAAGSALGLNSNPEGVQPGQLWLALVGTCLGAFLGLLYAGGLAAWLSRSEQWPRVVVRVLGSWTAACAFLVLVLEYAKSGGAT